MEVTRISNRTGLTDSTTAKPYLQQHYPHYHHARAVNGDFSYEPEQAQFMAGMKHLLSRVEDRINDDLPEISEHLLQMIAPQVLQAVPAQTIMQFVPDDSRLQRTQYLTKGIQVLSQPVGKQQRQCPFQTTHAVKMNPIYINSLQASTLQDGRQSIQLSLQTFNNILFDQLDLADLKFFLSAAPDCAYALLYTLTSQVLQVKVSFPQYKNWQPAVIGDQSLVTAPHASLNDGGLLRGDNDGCRGLQLLQDYFVFPEKYLFVNLQGLERVVWPEQCQEINIEFICKRSLPGKYILNKHMLQLNCSPAINLSSSTSEPVTIDGYHSEYPIMADSEQGDDVKIFSVDEVTGMQPYTGKREHYSPFMQYCLNRANDSYYQVLTREHAGESKFVLAIRRRSIEPETLSCKITTFNGDLPAFCLSPGDINVPGDKLPSFCGVRNLTIPTRVYYPAKRNAFCAQLVSHLAMHYQRLTELGNFKKMLYLYNLPKLDESDIRIESIQDIECLPMQQFHAQLLMRGFEVTVKIQSDNFVNIGEIYLLGSLLHQFFTLYTPLNHYVQTRVVCLATQEELKWKPQTGNRMML